MYSQFVILVVSFALFSTIWAELTEEEISKFNLPFEAQKNLPYFLSGYDKAGAPIWIMELGKWDVRSAIEGGPESSENLLTYAKQMLLRARDSGRKAGTGFVFIGNVNGFDIKQASHLQTTQFWLDFFRYMKEHFVRGDIKRGYIVHTNSMFEPLWESIGSVLGPAKSAFRVYDRLNPSWIPRVLTHISPKQLPSAYGGSAYRGPVQVFGR